MRAALLALFVSAGAVFAQSINTPASVSECKEVTITWQGGKSPYFLSVVPGDEPCDAALVELPQTNNTWLSWAKPNVTAGTKIIFALEDATGEEVWTNEITVQAGSDTSCLSSSSSANSTAVVDTPRSTTIVNVGSVPTPSDVSPASETDSPLANVGGAISAASSRLLTTTSVGSTAALVVLAFVSLL